MPLAKAKMVVEERYKDRSVAKTELMVGSGEKKLRIGLVLGNVGVFDNKMLEKLPFRRLL